MAPSLVSGEEQLDSDLLPYPLEYATLVPSTADAGAQLPLVLLLHGGGGDRTHLLYLQPLLEQAVASGAVQPAVFVTPSAGRSLYADYRDGSQRWATLLAGPFLDRLRATLPVSPSPGRTAVLGESMGGLGALRLGLLGLDRFGIVAALEPALDPAFSHAALRRADRFWHRDFPIAEVFGDPVDEAWWQASSPACIARRDAAAIRASAPALYLEVGDRDGLELYRGTELLHRVLWDAGILHEYRLVRGASHWGRSVPGRYLDALGFVGRALRGDLEEGPLPEMDAVVVQMRRWAGLSAQGERRTALPSARTRLS